MANEIVTFSFEQAQQLFDSTETFPVDFDLAWQWCGYSRRDSAKRKLKRFKSDRDFHIDVEKSEGRPFQRIWLSVDCFKHIAMMADSDAGYEVRGYFCNARELQKRLPRRLPNSR